MRQKKWSDEVELVCRERILDRAAYEAETSDEVLMAIIEEVLSEAAKEVYLPVGVRLPLGRYLFDTFRRLDILQELLEEEDITEIMVNGPDHIFVERRGKAISMDHHFPSKEKLEDVIQQIVAKVNRVVNETNPIVDARLSDGSRVNVVLPPIALNGPILTIRKFAKETITMERLICLGSLSSEMAFFLQKLVLAKYNIFISGGTGSGKTTFLNALSMYIPQEERIITIEDSAELQLLNQPNLVRLETRNGTEETEVTIRQLIRNSLRMNPDRIIVGEIRGEEALDMLMAMNTGHDGSLSTGHGNSPREMVMRMATMVMMGAELPLKAINNQIGSAIDILIHLGKLRDGSRKVLSIMEVGCGENGEVILHPVYEFRETKTGESGQVEGIWERKTQGLQRTDKLRMAGIPDTI